MLLEAFQKQQSSRSSEHTSAEGTQELEIALQTVDILDELNILLHLLETQNKVLASLHYRLTIAKPTKAKPQPTGHMDFQFSSSYIENMVITQSKEMDASFAIGSSQVENFVLSDGSSTAALGVLGIEGNAGVFIREAEHSLGRQRLDIQRLINDASQARKMVRTDFDALQDPKKLT